MVAMASSQGSQDSFSTHCSKLLTPGDLGESFPSPSLSVPTCERPLFLVKLHTALPLLWFPSMEELAGRKDSSALKGAASKEALDSLV